MFDVVWDCDYGCSFLMVVIVLNFLLCCVYVVVSLRAVTLCIVDFALVCLIVFLVEVILGLNILRLLNYCLLWFWCRFKVCLF